MIIRRKAMRLLSFSVLVSLATVASGQEQTQLLWGDTHLHTNISPDAFMMGNKTLDPDSAYRFAKGVPMVHPYHKSRVQLTQPLDFLVVADHAELMGVPKLMAEGDKRLFKTPLGREMGEMIKAGKGMEAFGKLVGMINRGESIEDLSTYEIRSSVWSEQVKIADRHNEPGKFTSFIGWEWSSIPDGSNLHRVVMTPGNAQQASQFVPYSADESSKPEDLWQWLDDTSIETGLEFLAIPHNSNISAGAMFPLADSDGQPITSAYAKTRMRWEPVAEITQIKGDSETAPNLSPNDEFADFETYSFLIKEHRAQDPEPDAGSYVRTGLMRGLELESSVGVNPYQMGVIGSTDSHTGLSTSVETNFSGKQAILSTPQNNFETSMGAGGPKGVNMSASGMAAVWAKENTRESIFNAFKRREVYATTGPRIALRVFGGWNFKTDDANHKDMATVGYQKGVPMGGELTFDAVQTGKPVQLLIDAVKDPYAENLDRIQVVKGWLGADGKAREKVFDVAWSEGRELNAKGKLPALANRVDLTTGDQTQPSGQARLSTLWADPEFDPAQRAFYYVRALQIPTIRHSTLDAVALGKSLEDLDLPLTLQERAYSSPIWYRGKH
jgi:Protein of unknown function (DUF3604)